MLEANPIVQPQNLLDSNYHTRLLREAVPAVDAIDFKFLEVEKGFVSALLPLNQFSSNQHGTHQAMLLAMGGDYVGGLALATMIDDEPILGVHEILGEKGMSLWLLKSEMSYRAPSTEDVVITATIPQEKSPILMQRYHDGLTILFDVEISFKNQSGKDVAIGVFKYYLKKKSLLHHTRPGKRMDAMFEHILKTSAKLIAQLRALEAYQKQPLFIDEISGKVAGKQGHVIAERFLKNMPQLQQMVAARTHHLDSYVSKNTSGFKQVVFVGAGLDFRMFRNFNDYQNLAIYEMDLAEMIEERNHLEKKYELSKNKQLNRTAIPCNFLTQSIIEQLSQSTFDSSQPTLIIFEGCSMYFTKEQNKNILSEIAEILKQNADSTLWMDQVEASILENPNKDKKAAHFLRQMSILGEPFIFGFKDNDLLLKEVGLVEKNSSNTAAVLSVVSNSIFDMYRFGVFSAL